jgi:hypothetical protein
MVEHADNSKETAVTHNAIVWSKRVMVGKGQVMMETL